MPKNVLTATATKVQNNFGSYLTKVTQTDKPVFVEKHGKPVAVLVSMDTWKDKSGDKGYKPSPWLKNLIKLSEEIKKKHPRQTPAVELIRQLREEATNDL